MIGLGVVAACSGSSAIRSGEVATTTGAASVAAGTSGATMTVVTPRTTMSIAAMADGTPPPLPAGASPFQVDLAGHQIHGIDIPGPGPAVVLLHGFPDNIHLYDRLYPLLAGRHHVVAFDFLGWGQSDKPPPGSYPYTSAGMTGEIAAVLRDRQLTGVTLVVHDASGPPGIDFALANPSAVAHLVLLNTYYALTPALRPPEAIQFSADASMQAVENALEADPAAVESMYRWQMSRFIVSAPDQTGFIDGLWSEFPEARPAFIALNDVLFDEVAARSANTLAGLTMPVTIAFGAGDPYLGTDVAKDFAAHIPGSKLTLIDHAGHFVQVDDPHAVAAAIGVP